MTVVYVDSVFFLNAAMDYLLLLSTGRLAGIGLRRRRYLLAAVLGGIYAVAVFLPGWGWLSGGPVKLAAGVLLALTAFGGEEQLLRLMLLLAALSCGMAGCVLGLGLLTGGVPMVNGVFYTDVDGRVLLIASAGAYAILRVTFQSAARHGLRGELVDVRLCLEGRTVELTALRDTGNALTDPLDGQPVLVAAPGALVPILRGSVRELLTPQALRSPSALLEPLREAAPALRFRLIPYHAVGSQGLLLAVRTDWMEVAGRRLPGVLAALSPTALGSGYTALWGGEALGGGGHGILETLVAGRADPPGPAALGRGPLHWRQRHAAVSPDEGAGRGAAGPPDRGGRQKRADRT